MLLKRKRQLKREERKNEVVQFDFLFLSDFSREGNSSKQHNECAACIQKSGNNSSIVLFSSCSCAALHIGQSLYSLLSTLRLGREKKRLDTDWTSRSLVGPLLLLLLLLDDDSLDGTVHAYMNY